MKKVLGLLLIAGVAMVSMSTVNAAETKDIKGIYEECGLGGLLFPSWPIGASVSNVTWDLGTTAATSGLTTPDSCKGGEAKLAAYIYESYDSIEQDLAKGDGKYLDMLAVLSEKQEAQKADFVASVRAQFLKAVEQGNYSTLSQVEKAQMLYSIVEQSV